jgi:EAL domain-containing protein (putative c-di-GMP-specific phosphodiesterase class I)
MGSGDEERYYRYGVARLAAFSNVMWDVANEYRFFRDDAWAEKMGSLIKNYDPYRHLTSTHGHEDFRFRTSPWADFAMYQAKEHGRNRAYLFAPDADAVGEAEAKLTWERRIREAIEQDRLALWYQPILDLQTGKAEHCELLLRMTGEDGEPIAPSHFLGVAERFGLIQTIDRWVVREAIRLLARAQSVGRWRAVEVNLSGLAFQDSELISIIRFELAATGADPAGLIMEITETAAIADLDAAREFVVTLRNLGCRFAIDDFGSGFASFAYLKHLPVDYLKIDGSFIRNLATDPVDQHLVRGMVKVARGLGKQTIAEFVGDEETVRLLREYGVDYAQGYHVGRPRPYDQTAVP